MAHIEVKGVSFYFGATKVLQNISLSLAQGELACLIGASGSGKTTLLRLLAGFEIPKEGEIFLREQAVAGSAFVPCRERRLGFVFQDYALFNHLTVRENIYYGCRTDQQRRHGDELATQLGLQSHYRKLPSQLSGGERQRVALVRALALAPDIILLDEPFTGIDRQLTGSLVKELRQLFKSLGVTALMITHSLDEAIGFADQLFYLDGGEILQHGKIVDFYSQPKNQRVRDFFGDAVLLDASLLSGSPHSPDTSAPPQKALIRTSTITFV